MTLRDGRSRSEFSPEEGEAGGCDSWVREGKRGGGTAANFFLEILIFGIFGQKRPL